MPWEDWNEGLQDVWNDVPGVSHFREYEREIAEDLFERAFTHYSDEPGYDRDDVQAARDEFFEFTGLPEELFPWDEWREEMGYD